MTREEIKNKVLTYVPMLEAGNDLVIENIKDRSNNNVGIVSLRFDETKGFILTRLACRKASSQDLGDCDCSDHDTFRSENINESIANSFLNELAKNDLYPDKTEEKKAKAAVRMVNLKRIINDENSVSLTHIISKVESTPEPQ